MMDRRIIAEQAARLAHCKYFPSTNPGPYLEEVVHALGSADSEIIAVAVIQEWVDTKLERPTIAELRQAIQRHNSILSAPGRDVCPQCTNTGLVILRLRFERCACVYGDRTSVASWVGRTIHPDDANGFDARD